MKATFGLEIIIEKPCIGEYFGLAKTSLLKEWIAPRAKTEKQDQKFSITAT